MYTWHVYFSNRWMKLKLSSDRWYHSQLQGVDGIFGTTFLNRTSTIKSSDSINLLFVFFYFLFKITLIKIEFVIKVFEFISEICQSEAVRFLQLRLELNSIDNRRIGPIGCDWSLLRVLRVVIKTTLLLIAVIIKFIFRKINFDKLLHFKEAEKLTSFQEISNVNSCYLNDLLVRQIDNFLSRWNVW